MMAMMKAAQTSSTSARDKSRDSQERDVAGAAMMFVLPVRERSTAQSRTSVVNAPFTRRRRLRPC
jgi:hypothetical protein